MKHGMTYRAAAFDPTLEFRRVKLLLQRFFWFRRSPPLVVES